MYPCPCPCPCPCPKSWCEFPMLLQMQRTDTVMEVTQPRCNLNQTPVTQSHRRLLMNRDSFKECRHLIRTRSCEKHR